MLGIEPARRHDFRRWSDLLIFSAGRPDRRKAPEFIAALADMRAYITAVAEERRRAPQGDLISLLVRDTEGTGALGPDEMNSFVILLLLAGNETTKNLLGNALGALVHHPEAYAWLRGNPTPAACAAVCEETLRYDSPVLALPRRATQDVELSGGKVAEGSMLFVLLGAANRDPHKFPDPERFEPQRDTQGMLAFGHGIHFCLGAPLSRLEAPVALEELMREAPSLGFSSRQAPPLTYEPSFIVRGPKTLWLQPV